jgi:hypothetical protein
VSSEFLLHAAMSGETRGGGGTQMFGTDDRIAHSPNKPHSVHFEGGKATNTNRPKKCSPVGRRATHHGRARELASNPQKELFGPLDRRGPTTIRDPDDPDRVATVQGQRGYVCGAAAQC